MEFFDDVEKPKKEKLPISQKQRERLEKAREKKAELAILRKYNKKESIESIPETIPETIPKNTNMTNNDLIKVSKDLEEIKNQLAEMKRLKEEKQKLKNSVDKKTEEETRNNHNDLAYRNFLKMNFIK